MLESIKTKTSIYKYCGYMLAELLWKGLRIDMHWVDVEFLYLERSVVDLIYSEIIKYWSHCWGGIMFSTIWCMLTVEALGNSICIAHERERASFLDLGQLLMHQLKGKPCNRCMIWWCEIVIDFTDLVSVSLSFTGLDSITCGMIHHCL